ncbi:MAG TPA: archaeosortase/exosortase family protein [Candidatus Limnocylindrales bacterium]|nr:archaeosortase/exosortase family protein [Candidatus Limnocylindrales bacterium]
MNNQSFLFILQFLAFWPVWKWYVLRLIDSPQELFGLIALGTAGGFILWRRPDLSSAKSRLILPAVFVLLYTVTYPFLPFLIKAAIALVAIGCTLSSYRWGISFHPGICGLLLLSLPVIPSLQFYLGYPLRVLTGILAVPLLQLGGFTVVREGTSLNWDGQLILIDAPCSGVRMLWSALYLTFTLTCFYGFNTGKTCLAVLLSFLGIIAGNALRSAALFYPEAHTLALPSWTHEGIGMVVFFFTAIFIVGGIRWIRKKFPLVKRVVKRDA